MPLFAAGKSEETNEKNNSSFIRVPIFMERPSKTRSTKEPVDSTKITSRHDLLDPDESSARTEPSNSENASTASIINDETLNEVKTTTQAPDSISNLIYKAHSESDQLNVDFSTLNETLNELQGKFASIQHKLSSLKGILNRMKNITNK